jgi:hypothetical protein
MPVVGFSTRLQTMLAQKGNKQKRTKKRDDVDYLILRWGQIKVPKGANYSCQKQSSSSLFFNAISYNILGEKSGAP